MDKKLPLFVENCRHLFVNDGWELYTDGESFYIKTGGRKPKYYQLDESGLVIECSGVEGFLRVEV